MREKFKINRRKVYLMLIEFNCSKKYDFFFMFSKGRSSFQDEFSHIIVLKLLLTKYTTFIFVTVNSDFINSKIDKNQNEIRGRKIIYTILNVIVNSNIGGNSLRPKFLTHASINLHLSLTKFKF